jgi:F0F1-type ATP synthase membrane subunit a
MENIYIYISYKLLCFTFIFFPNELGVAMTYMGHPLPSSQPTSMVNTTFSLSNFNGALLEILIYYNFYGSPYQLQPLNN